MATKTKSQNLTGLRASAGNRTLQFGLVTIDIAMSPLFDDLRKARPESHLYCPEHHARVQQRWGCSDGGELVEEPVYGFNFDESIIEMTKDELNQLKSEEDPTIQLTAFVTGFLDPMYFEKSYLIWPKNQQDAERYMILVKLLQDEDGYLIGSSTGDHGNTRSFAVRWSDETGTLIAHTLHYGVALRRAQADKVAEVIGQQDEPSSDMMAVAKQVFDQLPNEFDESAVQDSYGELLQNVIQSKALSGAFDITAPARSAKEHDDNLMEQLRASVEGKKKRSKAKASA
jgi:DNA end-binding protein Ku